jgi:hypothetical protein
MFHNKGCLLVFSFLLKIILTITVPSPFQEKRRQRDRERDEDKERERDEEKERERRKKERERDEEKERERQREREREGRLWLSCCLLCLLLWKQIIPIQNRMKIRKPFLIFFLSLDLFFQIKGFW